jgi:hypothetical protein
MPQFHVYGAVYGTKYLGKFEAKTKDEAIKLAESNASVCLCHQCSSEVDSAEIQDITAEEIE